MNSRGAARCARSVRLAGAVRCHGRAPRRLHGLRVAVSSSLGTATLPDEETQAAVAAAGATVTAADPAWRADPATPFAVFWAATYAGFLDAMPAERAAHMIPPLHRIAARGRRIDILAYHGALTQRPAITAAAHDVFQRFDLMLRLVMPAPAFNLKRGAG
jgi:aspartyl-tRNA(Asn)/glutamyl-tRNA(Gln) amidotransferase subunit A